MDNKHDIRINYYSDCHKVVRLCIHAFIENRCIDETTYAVMEMIDNDKIYNPRVLLHAMPGVLFDRWAIFRVDGRKYMLLIPVDQQSPKCFYSNKFHQRVTKEMNEYFYNRLSQNAAKGMWVFKHNPVDRDKAEERFEQFMKLRKEH